MRQKSLSMAVSRLRQGGLQDSRRSGVTSSEITQGNAHRVSNLCEAGSAEQMKNHTSDQEAHRERNEFAAVRHLQLESGLALDRR
jgi:hypothetical protein